MFLALASVHVSLQLNWRKIIIISNIMESHNQLSSKMEKQKGQEKGEAKTKVPLPPQATDLRASGSPNWIFITIAIIVIIFGLISFPSSTRLDSSQLKLKLSKLMSLMPLVVAATVDLNHNNSCNNCHQEIH